MSAPQLPLITAFFKSPPQPAEEALPLTPATNGDRSQSERDEVCSVGECSEGGGESEGEREGETGRKLTVSLCGLLNGGSMGYQKPSCNNLLPPPHTTHTNTTQNRTNHSSMFGSGMRQGTLTWDASSGTLALKPPTPTQQLATPTIDSDTERCVADRERGGEVSEEKKTRRNSHRQCRVADYSEALESCSSEGEVYIKKTVRTRSYRLNGSALGLERERKRKKRRRRWRRSISDRQLVVTVKLDLLRHHQVNGCTGGGDGSPHSEPDTGNGIVLVESEPDPGSEVDVTGYVKGASLDQSVVIVGATSPPTTLPPSPTTLPPSSALSGAWAKIFSQQPPKQEQSNCKPVREDTLTRGSSRPGSPSRSPRRHRSSVPGSPLRRSLSRSPRGCRSSRQCYALHSPRKGGSTPASPLRSSLAPRKLVLHTPTAGKRCHHDYDRAPFSGLVHVTQSDRDTCTLTPTTLPRTNLKPAMTTQPQPSPHLSLHSCVTAPDPRTPAPGPLLTAVIPDQKQALLEELIRAHPHERVEEMFHRYCHIRGRGPVQSHPPPTHTSTSSLPRASQAVSTRHRRRPLVCSVHVVNSEEGGVKVDGDAYQLAPRRKSLRLSRKRSASVTSEPAALSETDVRTVSTSPAVAAEVCGGRKEGESVCSDLWSDLYRPQSSGEVIGNKVKVQRLFDWLRTWKNKCTNQQDMADHLPPPASRKRRRKQWSDTVGSESCSSRERSLTPEWVCDDKDFLSLSHIRRRRKRVVMSSDESEGEEGGRGCEGGEGVSSVLLLCGGVGCGKTAAVYACAAELSYKVFEVNSSTVRSRGSLLATLKEATLSHQVSVQPRVDQQPTGPSREPRGVHRSAGGQGGGRRKAQRREGILSFFKPHQSQTSSSRPVALETCTVILLEEVDILFDNDRGFWSGVYELIATTRRPLILTCNDPRYDLDCDYIKLVFDSPSLVELGMHMQLLCLSRDYHMTSDTAVQLADYLHADIRRVFLYLQFWTHNITSTPHTLTTSPPAHPTPPPVPCLVRPWQPLKRCLPTTDAYKDMDRTSHSTDQHSCRDIATVETRSCDRHMMQIDDIMRPWWVCPDETSSVIDELPERESRWREEEVTRYLCEEVEREVGEVVRPGPVVWREFTRRVESVRQCLVRCAEVFGCRGSRVGVATDGLPFLRYICSIQHQQQASNTKRRFRHYLKACPTVELTELQALPLTTRFTASLNCLS